MKVEWHDVQGVHSLYLVLPTGDDVHIATVWARQGGHGVGVYVDPGFPALNKRVGERTPKPSGFSSIDEARRIIEEMMA